MTDHGQRANRQAQVLKALCTKERTEGRETDAAALTQVRGNWGGRSDDGLYLSGCSSKRLKREPAETGRTGLRTDER